MQFSKRCDWPPRPNALSRELRARSADGRSFLDLTAGNPTTAAIAYHEGMILQALGDPGALVYRPDPRGSPEARRAVAAELSDLRGVLVDPDRIVLTASTSEAYGFIFKLLCDPGDVVHVPVPSYPLLAVLAQVDGVELASYTTRYDGEWHIDVANLERQLTARSRAIVVINPNNPTGCYLKRDELGRLRSLDLPIVSDEVFFEYPLPAAGTGRTSLLSAAECPGFVLGGLSKLAGLPQVKLGWTIVTGDTAWVDEALRRLGHLGDALLSVSASAQAGAAALLRAGRSIRAQIQERVRGNAAWLLSACAGGESLDVLPAEGGWSAVVRVPRMKTDEEWCLELLDRDDVLVHPGYFFDFREEGNLVVSLLTPTETLQEGFRRLQRRVAAGN